MTERCLRFKDLFIVYYFFLIMICAERNIFELKYFQHYIGLKINFLFLKKPKSSCIISTDKLIAIHKIQIGRENRCNFFFCHSLPICPYYEPTVPPQPALIIKYTSFL